MHSKFSGRLARMTKYAFAALSVALVCGASAGTSQATVIVAPAAQAATAGAAGNNIPFFGSGGRRLQQVYAASEFSAFSGPETITGLAFRCDVSRCPSGPFSIANAATEIRLSTTSRAPDGLSTTYSDNVGADVTLVHTGALTLTSGGTAGGPGPNPFDIVITLQTGFLYDPGLGNLLLDVINPTLFPSNISIFLDGVNTVGDSVSRIFSLTGLHGGTDGFADSLGLITQFTTSAQSPQIPEPGTLFLFAVGLIGMAFARYRSAAPAFRA